MTLHSHYNQRIILSTMTLLPAKNPKKVAERSTGDRKRNLRKHPKTPQNGNDTITYDEESVKTTQGSLKYVIRQCGTGKNLP